MLTPYDRKQQARERAALAARTELDNRLLGAPLAPSCNWDEEFARIVLDPPQSGGAAC